jgi:hypothetical protein
VLHFHNYYNRCWQAPYYYASTKDFDGNTIIGYVRNGISSNKYWTAAATTTQKEAAICMLLLLSAVTNSN